MHQETTKEIKSSCPSLGEAVNKAAKLLPENWLIKIMVEKHGYGVSLVNTKEGEYMDVDGDGIIECVNDAIAIANGLEPS